MAAIATIHTFGGTGFTGFTELGGGVSESAGALVVDNNAVDCGLIRDAAFTETNTNAANGTKGVIQKFTLNTTPTDGSKIRFIVNYVDADNYHYAELHKGGVTIFDDLKNDRVTLWKRAAAVESQIGSSTTLLYKQTTTGDLRHAKMEAGDAVTIMKCLNQYVVKVTASDPYDGRDWVDVVHLLESDGSVAAANEQAGIIFKGGQSHTNSISLWQGDLITCHHVTKTGNDSTGNGSQPNPFLTIKKGMETTLVNQHLWIGAGTYDEGVGEGIGAPYNSTLANGTSWEDAPTFMPLSGAAVTQRNGGAGCYYVKGVSGGSLPQYRVLFGWTMSGVNPGTGNPAAANVVKLWTQSTGRSPQRFRFQRMIHEKSNDGTNIIAGGLRNATATDWELYHHWLDCESNDGNRTGPTQETHGWYVVASWNLVEYCKGLRNTGNGGKFLDGETVSPTVCNDNIIRFSLMDQNNKAGWINGTGTDNWAHSNIFSNSQPFDASLVSQSGGFIITRGAVDNLAWNNVSYGNAWDGFGVWGHLGDQCTGSKFINNTSYGNKYNFTLQTTSSPPGGHPSNTLWMNNSANAPTSGGKNYYEPIAGSTGTTFTTNHEDAADSPSTGWIGSGVRGDPKFVDAGMFDFHLRTDSPLAGAGTDPTAYFTEDADRQPIPQVAATWDIGAFFLDDPTLPITNVLSSGATVTKDVEATVSLDVTGDGQSLLVEARGTFSQGLVTDIDVSGGATSHT